MLVALELLGFKSFPDKTRFDFPAGITVVVGPNGSGKSNVVDAIKWCLGEQRAKSLRGKEMADVIFKGSGNGRRKPSNTAEATIIFDNSEGLLPIEATEVHVTRRVYRSGEGEYLINGQACRLRDVKDLFRGTGVGTDAYSLIEQGKVDTMLQASPKDRRAIFEEAAGISRFKAKKVEALRRLERVEQNLLRLSDIVDEVDGRLKRLRSQATKAQRYKDHTERLQSLRTQVGRVDWQEMSTRLLLIEAELASLHDQVAGATSRLESGEATVLELETETTSAEELLRAREASAARHRERLAASEAAITNEHLRLADFKAEVTRARNQVVAMTGRAGGLQLQLVDAAAAIAKAEQEHQSNSVQLLKRQTAHSELVRELDQAKEATEEKRASFVTHMRRAADLGNRITAQQTLLDAKQSSLAKADEELRQLDISLTQAQHVAEQQQAQQASLSQQLAEVDRQLAQSTRETAELDEHVSATREEVSRLSRRQAAVRERAAVLKEIEARMEGVGDGVKQVLELAGSDDAGPFSGVRGMVANLIEVSDQDKADMIEVALGERAQHLVVAGSQLADYLETHRVELAGRVGFVRLHSSAPPRLSRRSDLTGQSGIIGRADRFVTAQPQYAHLIGWLLRDTWLVESLVDAIQFARSINEPVRFVTRVGELLDHDGRLLLGPVQHAVGLISRKTELRRLVDEQRQLDEDMARAEQSLVAHHEQLQSRRKQTDTLDARQREVAQQLTRAHAEAETAAQRVRELRKQQDALRREHDQADAERATAETTLIGCREQLQAVELAIRDLENTLAAERDTAKDLEEQVAAKQHDVTEWEVVVAKSEQRLDALQLQLEQFQRDQHERAEAVARVEHQLDRCLRKTAESEMQILAASSEVARLATQVEADRLAVRELAANRDEVRLLRKATNEDVNELRGEIRKLEQQQHLQELEAEKIRHERAGLANRLEEDYGITTEMLDEQPTEEEQAEREQIDAEIAGLRRKIGNLGAVNMDALAELDQLDERYASLSAQYNDLVQAKESLERIIHRINADSRRLFTETLEAIRQNFGVLFRKVFGGGSADIVLEEGVDILESGIDIVATPPGKQSLGLSLLSGGERALAAVTLLLAIFEYRPSPFCVLDEVDGPLDEANIGRFIDVLNEFLTWTKFVVVTHSKKTMTAANTLYGVTMQESGVSKRVSVRFDEVNEHGEISENALHRQAGSDDERAA